MSNPSTPFPWKGDARRAGGWPKAKRAKPTSGATRHLLPEEGGRSGENYLLPSRGRGWQTNESRAFWHCHSLSGAALYFYAPHHAHCIFSACSLIPVFQRSPL